MKKIKRFVSGLCAGALVLSLFAQGFAPAPVYAAGQSAAEDTLGAVGDGDEEEEGYVFTPVEGFDFQADEFLTKFQNDNPLYNLNNTNYTVSGESFGNFAIYNAKTVKKHADRLALTEKSRGYITVSNVPACADEDKQYVLRLSLASPSSDITGDYIVKGDRFDIIASDSVTGNTVFTTVDVDASVPELNPDNLESFSFYVYSGTNKLILKSITLGTVPKKVFHNVTFKWGNNEKTIKVEDGKAIKAADVPDVSELEFFSYWITEGQKIEPAGFIVRSDVTMKAVTEDRSQEVTDDPYHVVRFMRTLSDNTAEESEVSFVKKPHGSALLYEDIPSIDLGPEEEFLGWYEGEDSSKAVFSKDLAGINITNDTVYHASIVSADDHFKVDFDIDDDTVYSMSVKEGDNAVTPAVTRQDILSVSGIRKFDHWSLTPDGDALENDWKPDRDTRVYAVFEDRGDEYYTSFSGHYYMFHAHYGNVTENSESYYVSDSGSTESVNTETSSTTQETFFNVTNGLVKSGKWYSGVCEIDNSAHFSGSYLDSSGKDKTNGGYVLNDTYGTTTFTTTDERDLYILVPNFYSDFTKMTTYNSRSIKIDGVEYIPSDGVLKIEGLPAGSHTISKGSGESVIMDIILAKGSMVTDENHALTVEADPDKVETTLIEGNYYSQTDRHLGTVDFAALPKKGYGNLVVKAVYASEEKVLKPNEYGTYEVEMNADVKVVMTVDEYKTSDVSLHYSGASSSLASGTYEAGTKLDFSARANPGFTGISVTAEKNEDGTDVTNDCIIVHSNGSYILDVPEYDITVTLSATEVVPSGIKVKNGKEDIAVYPGSPSGSLTVLSGTELTLDAVILPEGANFLEKWSSSDPEVATVRRGKIVTLKDGDTTINASVNGNILTEILLKVVYPQPESAAIKNGETDVTEEKPLEITIGDSASLTDSVLPADVEYSASWESDDTGVAAVEDGTVKGVSPGVAHITLTVTGKGKYHEVKTAKAKVIVHDILPTALLIKDAEGNVLTPDTEVSLTEGDTLRISVTKQPANATGSITLSSNKPLVAYADTVKSEIKALIPGDAVITATVKWDSGVDKGEYDQTFSVKVNPILPERVELKDPEGNILNEDSVISLKDGETFKPTAAIIPAGALGALTYKSSAEGVAKVNHLTGEVTAVSAGTATITATVTWLEGLVAKTLTQTYKVKVLSHIDHTVTFRVQNGSWNDGTKDDKTVVLSGYEGDKLCIPAGQIPAAGDKPDVGFETGAWDVIPDADTVIMGDTVYTYKYLGKDSVILTVTFRVENGSWDDGTKDNKTVKLIGFKGETLKLSESQIPAAGNNPDEGFEAGAWKVKPDTDTVITKDTSYTYRYVKKQTPDDPDHPDDPEDPDAPEEEESWDLFKDIQPHEYILSGIDSPKEIPNSNKNSVKYFTATLEGDKISAALIAGADRKKAAANNVLDFDLEDGRAVSFTIPAVYNRPVLKLSSTKASVRSGVPTDVVTTVLVQTENGGLTPFDLEGATVTYGSAKVNIGEAGELTLNVSDKASGKIVISRDEKDGGENWAEKLELKFTVSASKKDVIAVDLGGLKQVVLNVNSPDQVLEFPITLNGKLATGETVEIAEDTKKRSHLLGSVEDGVLSISVGKSGIGKGSYTLNLKGKTGDGKLAVKVRVSDKQVSATGKVKQKMDVVTKTPMLVVPTLKEIGGQVLSANVLQPAGSYKATVSGGNINVFFADDTVSEKLAGTKGLSIGDMSLELYVEGLDEPVKLVLKNVSAKKTTPAVKAPKVVIPKSAVTDEDSTLAEVNITGTWKDASKALHVISPLPGEKGMTLTPNNVKAEIDPEDNTHILIKGFKNGKTSGNIKAVMTFPGGVTKTVTIKVSQGK